MSRSRVRCFAVCLLVALGFGESEAWVCIPSLQSAARFRTQSQPSYFSTSTKGVDAPRRRSHDRRRDALEPSSFQFHSKMTRLYYSSNGDGPSNEEDLLLESDDKTSARVTSSKANGKVGGGAGPNDLPSSPMVRWQRTLSIDSKQAAVCSRTIPVTPSWSITVWEWMSVSPVIETYWQVEQQGLQVSKGGGRREGTAGGKPKVSGLSSSTGQSAMLDPFGLVTWPGSVVAALEMLRHHDLVRDRVVFVIGAGVGVEAQAAAALGAKKVIATDVHPTTMRLLEYGVQQASDNLDPDRVETRTWDLFGNDAIPDDVDLVVCADVLYNDNLASQLVKRICPLYEVNDRDDDERYEEGDDDGFDFLGNETLSEDSVVPNATAALPNGAKAQAATESNRGGNGSPRPSPVTLIVDSQRFCHGFEHDLNAELRRVGRRRKKVAWESRYLPMFTGSGILVEEDQTYDVKARVLWIQP